MNPKVSIIILNWNGWRDTIECLESLYQITYPNYDVVVVDNGSEDESIEKIKEYAEGKIKVESKFFEYSSENKPIKIIEYTREEAEAGGGKEKEITDLPSNKKMIIIKNEKNYGFAEGNNIGMRYALKALNPDYILLLNNDTVVDKEFLGELVNVAGSDEKIGIVGSKIYYYDEPNKIHFGGGKINWGLGRPIHRQMNSYDEVGTDNTPEEVEFITGCCMLINTKMEDNVFFDKIYFSYFEDADLCVKLKRNAYILVYNPASKIWHKISKSSGFQSEFFNYYFGRNRIIFMKKYAKFKHKILFYPFQVVLKVLGSFLYFGIKYGNLKLAYAFTRGVKDGLKYNRRDLNEK